MSLFSPIAALSLATIIFAIDTLTPFDIAIAVLYVAVVLLALNFADRRRILLIGAGCMALTLLSFILSHGARFDSGPVARCLVSLSAIGITTLLAAKVKAGIAVLGESERRYRHIFLATGVAILEMDFSEVGTAIAALKTAGRGIDAVRAEDPGFARRMLGKMRLINANDTTLTMFGAGSVADFRAALPQLAPKEMEGALWSMLSALWDGSTAYEAESLMGTLDGRRLNVLFTVAVPSERPELGQVLVTIMDVTARREAEDALHHAQAELAHVTRVATLGELTASIAHEVNQPLAAIVTNGEAGLRWLNRPEPELQEGRTSLQSMVDDAKRASAVIKRLRALSSKSTPQQAAFALDELITETVTLVRRELDGHRAHLSLKLDEDLPPAFGDRVQIQQVLINLIVNACQAMGTVEGRPRDLGISCSVADGALEMTVADSGPGFDPDTASSLFNAFYTTKANGMGMGLSICRSILEAHGGRIRASAAHNAGATFTVSLPAHKEAL
ncbi:sensor histidine kinase [Bosea caraganae]|nr:ATP-binding protein [Bosea caraganae]